MKLASAQLPMTPGTPARAFAGWGCDLFKVHLVRRPETLAEQVIADHGGPVGQSAGDPTIFVLSPVQSRWLWPCWARRFWIKLLLSHGYSQAIRVSTADEPYPEHEGKRGTPSMGGVAILAVLLGYTVSHLRRIAPSVSGLLALFLMLGLRRRRK